MMVPAIVLSSHTIGLAVVRALGIMGVPVIVFYYEKKDMGYVSKYVKERIYTPHPEKYEDKFLNLLLDHGKRFNGGVLIPADDATLTVVSKNKRILAEHYIVACPDWEIAEKFVDKKHTYALAESVGVPVPKSVVPHSLEDVKRYGKIIDYPCLVKPCRSHLYFELFSRKMVKVNNRDELVAAYREAEGAGIEVLLQEYIPGDDKQGVNYNSYFWNGKPLVEFTAHKCRLAQPGFGVPRVVRSINIPELIEPGRKIVQALGFYGFSCTEFKKDARDGVYKFMEVNGRHNRSGLLAVYCGINFPFIEYKHLTENKLPKESGFRTDIYWIDEISDLLKSIRYYDKEKYSLIEYVRPYLKPHVFAVFDMNDPKPLVKRLMDVSKMALQRVTSFF